MTAKIIAFPGAYAGPSPEAIAAANAAYRATRPPVVVDEGYDDEPNYDPECDCGACLIAADRYAERKAFRVIANPAYWSKDQHGVTYLDTRTGAAWSYKHGWHSGQWAHHAPDDEPDAFFGVGNNSVPETLRDLAAPLIETYPPFKSTTSSEDYV